MSLHILSDSHYLPQISIPGFLQQKVCVSVLLTSEGHRPEAGRQAGRWAGRRRGRQAEHNSNFGNSKYYPSSYKCLLAFTLYLME